MNTAQIDRWPDDRAPGNPSAMVQKLRTLKYPLTNKQIAEVLEAIDETCHFCWDGPKSNCSCARDE